MSGKMIAACAACWTFAALAGCTNTQARTSPATNTSGTADGEGTTGEPSGKDSVPSSAGKDVEVLRTWVPRALPFLPVGGPLGPPVVDREAGVVYAMAYAQEGTAQPKHGTPRTRLVARKVESGQETWATTGAAVPLVVEGGRLIALEASGTPSDLVMLDPATGKRIARCTGSQLTVGEGLGNSSDVRGMPHGGRSHLLLESRSWYAGGAAPSPEEMRASRTRSTSVRLVTVDGKTCSASHVEKDPFAEAAGSQPGERVLERRPGEGGVVFTLRDPEGDRVLVEHRAEGTAHHVVSPDGLHLAIQEQTGSGAPVTYRTTLWDARTGERIARHDLPFGVGSFAVVGDRLLANAGQMLIVLDVGTGKQVWSLAVPSLRYSGPYPP